MAHTHRSRSLQELPRDLIAQVVTALPYSALPSFRATCSVARDLVDSASNGWVMKVEECEALQTSRLLYRLTSLAYFYFEGWTWDDAEREANFLAVVLTHLSVFGKVQEVRFPATATLPFRCCRGLLAALTSVTALGLPPLHGVVIPDSAQYTAAVGSVAALGATLTDLSLDGWRLTDAAARTLSSGLSKLQRLNLGNTEAVTHAGYAAIARLTGLVSLTASGVHGSNATLQPLTALLGLTTLRVELATAFWDRDPGPLARQPLLRALGWWHSEPQPSAELRAGQLGGSLRHLSLCMHLDQRALELLAGSCPLLEMLQVQAITLRTIDPAEAAAAAAAAVATAAARAPTGPDVAGPGPAAAAAAPVAAGPQRPARQPSLGGASPPTSPAAALAALLRSASRGSSPPRPAPLQPQPAVSPLSTPGATWPGYHGPVLSSVRTLILGELDMPPATEPQPVARLTSVFPGLENFMTFMVLRRGLMQLEKADKLKRLVLNCQHIEDEAMAFLPSLPSLTGLQLDGCQHLTAASLPVLRCTPGVTTLMLIDLPCADDAFLSRLCDGGAAAAGGGAGAGGVAGAGTPGGSPHPGGASVAVESAASGAAGGADVAGTPDVAGASAGLGAVGGGGLLPALKGLVLSKLDNLGDEGVQALAGLSATLEQVELRALTRITPACLDVVGRLPHLSLLCVCECSGIERAHTRALAEGLRVAGRDDISVEYESVMVAAPTLADEFSELAAEEAGAGGKI
ncbi:hypothetical protein HYH02_009282 [Chlamydomonas schloesseri]|uniref:F-box domain-containing protein n=1 Tax=Chlamydomonas schloesseri TaxID=2026947 RepID=A0A835TFL6_9CHLO|nr:hypothetical protein HYH02_009282 [Chlamydomonas schloesseri]|eukprot:KAG2443206.1 hypothetical protein HYH02_009282 [Chlamydomonas schloesseri]